MLGKNYYKIKGINDLKKDDYQSLFLMYQPLILNDALMIYCLFLNRIKDDGHIIDLLNQLNMTLDSFALGLEKLNEYRLLDTYHDLRNDNYLFILREPKSTRRFLQDELFSRILLDTIGKNRYSELYSNLYVQKENLSTYTNETKHLKINSLINWSQDKEDTFHQIKKPVINDEYKSNFDIKKFLNEASPILLPLKFRTKEILNTIARYADVFNISQDKMRVIIGNTVNSNQNEFNFSRFKKLCSQVHQNFNKIEKGNYDVPCTLFLMNLQGGKALSPADMNLISDLIDNYYLNIDVVNVLIEHSLKVCNNRLIGSYIKALASDLHRNDIKNADEAIAFLNQKSKVNTSHPKDVLPTYDVSENPNYNISDSDLMRFIKESSDE